MKKKLLFVTVRYGIEVVGGIEMHVRLLAEHLNDLYDVTVLTTQAKDYTTWKNEYTHERETINGVTVLRFPVDHNRYDNKLDFNIYERNYSEKEEKEWIKAVGPYSSPLFEYLTSKKHYYDWVLFAPYDYALTYFGHSRVDDKAVLIPAVHDHPILYIPMFRKLFTSVKGIICSTPEELELIQTVFDVKKIPATVIGTGIGKKIITSKGKTDLLQKNNIKPPYAVYLGRIDEQKGVKQAIDYIIRYNQEHKAKVTFVLAGKKVMDIPRDKNIQYIGYLTDEEKQALLQNALCLVNPSAYESLSLVVLETWLQERPVLVNAACNVLVGQCRRSQGGLWYDNYDQFEAMLHWLQSHQEEADCMGKQGRNYLESTYSWDTIVHKVKLFLNTLS